MRPALLPSLYIMSRFVSLGFGCFLKGLQIYWVLQGSVYGVFLENGRVFGGRKCYILLKSFGQKTLWFPLDLERTMSLRKLTYQVRSTVFLRSQCGKVAYPYNMESDWCLEHSRFFQWTRHGTLKSSIPLRPNHHLSAITWQNLDKN